MKNSLAYLRRWRADRPDRTLLLGILTALIALAVAAMLLPASTVEGLLATLIPSTSRESGVRGLLLSRHRPLFGGAAAAGTAVILLAPHLARLLRRVTDWLTRLDRRVFLGGIVIVTVAMRLGLVGQLQPVVPGQDTGHYVQLANTLLDEGRYIEYASHPGEPDGYRAWRPPGYPAALSVALLLADRQPWAIVALNTLWMVLLVLALYYLVRRLGTEPQARFATVACAFYPTLLAASLAAMSELQFTSLLVLATFLLFAWRNDRLSAFLGGVVLGLAALTRGSGLLLLPGVLALYAIYHWRSTAAGRWPSLRSSSLRVGLICLGFLLAVGPWVARNRIVLDAWVPVATSGGFNLYVGHHPEGSGVVQEAEFPYFPPGLGEVETARYGTRHALGYWLEEPVANLRLGAKALVAIVKVDAGALRVVYPEGVPGGGSGRSVSLALLGLFNLIYYSVWFLAGLWLLGRVTGRWPPNGGAGVLVAIALLYLATFIPFFGWQRYKIPMLPFLVAVACMALVTLSRPSHHTLPEPPARGAVT